MKAFFLGAFLGFFLSLIDGSTVFAVQAPLASPLPSGIPTLSAHESDCYTQAEIDQYNSYLDSTRVHSAYCSKGILSPVTIVLSYSPYVPQSDGGTGQSIYDCVSVRQRKFGMTLKMQLFAQELAKRTDTATEQTKSPANDCAVEMLSTWAEAGAMKLTSTLGSPRQSAMDRMWVLGSLGSAYLKHYSVRAEAQATTDVTVGNKNQLIRSWLSSLAQIVYTDIQDERDRDARTGLHGDQDNLQFWRGYAVLTIAILQGDPVLLARSKETFMTAMGQIEGDLPANQPLRPETSKGFLPHELERINKAAYYTSFASYPVIGMAALSMAYGCDFGNTSWRTNQLSYLLRKAVEGKASTLTYQHQVWNRFGPSGPTPDPVVATYDDAAQDATEDSRRLMDLVTGFPSSKIAKNVEDYLVTKGKTVSWTLASDHYYWQLGGDTRQLWKGIDRLRTESKPALSGVCGLEAK